MFDFSSCTKLAGNVPSLGAVAKSKTSITNIN